MEVYKNKIFLETPRLILREMELSDAEHMFDLNSDPEVVKYTGDTAFASLVEARVLIKNYSQYRDYRMGRLSVFEKNSSEYLGFCGLKYHPENGDVDLGFRLKKKFWGKGFATEASLACLDYGFNELKLPRIVGRAMKENFASIRVLEKVGMKFFSEFDFEGNPGVIYEKENI